MSTQSKITQMALGSLFAFKAAAAPFVTVQHPESVKALGGMTERTVDCATLERHNNTLWMTCEFGKQVDSNGQSACEDSKIKSESATLENYYSTAMYKNFFHAGSMHKQCTKIAGTLDSKLGKDVGYIKRTYGSNWQNGTDCPLVDAMKLCHDAMK